MSDNNSRLGSSIPPHEKIEKKLRGLPGIQRVVSELQTDDLEGHEDEEIYRNILAKSNPDRLGGMDILSEAQNVNIHSDKIKAKGSLLKNAEDVSINSDEIKAKRIVERAKNVDIQADTIRSTSSLGNSLGNSEIEANTIKSKRNSLNDDHSTLFSRNKRTKITAEKISGSAIFDYAEKSIAVVDDLYADDVGHGSRKSLIAAENLYETPEHIEVRDHELPLTTTTPHTKLESKAVIISPQSVEGVINYKGDWNELKDSLQNITPDDIDTEYISPKNVLDNSYDTAEAFIEDLKDIEYVDTQLDSENITENPDETIYTVLANEHGIEKNAIEQFFSEYKTLAADIFAHPNQIKTIEKDEGGFHIVTRSNGMSEAEDLDMELEDIEARSLFLGAQNISFQASTIETNRYIATDNATNIALQADRITARNIGQSLEQSLIEAGYIGAEYAFRRAENIDIQADTIEAQDAFSSITNSIIESDTIEAENTGYWAENTTIKAETVKAHELYERARESSIKATNITADEVLTDAWNTTIITETLDSPVIGKDSRYTVIAAEEVQSDIETIGDKATLITADDIDEAIHYTGDWDTLQPLLDEEAMKLHELETLKDYTFETSEALQNNIDTLSLIHDVSHLQGSSNETSANEFIKINYQDNREQFVDAASEYGEDFINSFFIIDNLFDGWKSFYEDYGDTLEEEDFTVLQKMYKERDDLRGSGCEPPAVNTLLKETFEERREDLQRYIREGKDGIVSELPLLDKLGIDLETAEYWVEGKESYNVMETVGDIWEEGRERIKYTEDELADLITTVMEDYQDQFFELDDDTQNDVVDYLFDSDTYLGKEPGQWIAGDNNYEEDIKAIEALQKAVESSPFESYESQKKAREHYNETREATQELIDENSEIVESMLRLEFLTDQTWDELINQDRKTLERQTKAAESLYKSKDYNVTDEELKSLYTDHEDRLHDSASSEEGRYIIRNIRKIEPVTGMEIEEFFDTFSGGAPDEFILSPDYEAEKLITTDGTVTDDVDEAATQAYQDGIQTLERLARNAGRFTIELPDKQKEELVTDLFSDEIADTIDIHGDDHILSQIGQEIGKAYQNGNKERAETLKDAKNQYKTKIDQKKREQALEEVGLSYNEENDFSETDPQTVRTALDQLAQEYLDDCQIKQRAEEISESMVVDTDIGGNQVTLSAWDKDLDTLPYKERSVPCTFPGGMENYEHNFLGYMADGGTHIVTIETGDKSGAALFNIVEDKHDDTYLFLHSVESDDGITSSTDVSKAIDEGIREYTQTVRDDPSEPDIDGLIYSMDSHNSAAKDFQDIVKEQEDYVEEELVVEKYGREDTHFDINFAGETPVNGYRVPSDEL